MPIDSMEEIMDMFYIKYEEININKKYMNVTSGDSIPPTKARTTSNNPSTIRQPSNPPGNP